MVQFSSLSLLLLLLFSTAIITVVASTISLKIPLLHKRKHPAALETLVAHLHHRRTRNLTVQSPVVSGAASGSGQYFVSLQIGSPPQPLLLVADTGSDLIWVTCSACRRNCSAHPPGSAFLARHSTSFSPHHCYDATCRLIPHPRRNHCRHTILHSPCRYEYTYADGSLTNGFFSKEKITLNTSSGQEFQLKDFHFGCGFRTSGPSITGNSFNGAHGVMGLGQGSISLSSQLGRRYGNKFSYCLMDYTLMPPATSFLTIGGEENDVVMRKTKLRFTPLLSNPLSPTFYYIGIKTAYVDNVKLRINPAVWLIDESGNGGTVIDSGTTLTFLLEPAYREVFKEFKRRVKLPAPAQSPMGFDLCVNVSGVSRPRFPRLSFKLIGGSVLRPPPRNYFIETDLEVKCLAIQTVNTVSGISVFGNLMQQGFLFEFDRDRSRLGFSRRGCAVP